MEFFSGLFTPDPGVIDGILAISVLYALCIGPGRRYLAPDEPFEKRRAVYFGMGVLVLIGAVATPIDHIGETYLFCVHMLQHVILIYLVPPLFLLGCPPWLADFLLRTEGLGSLLKFLVKPVVACIVFNATLLFWHVPPIYEFALRDPLIHLLEHASFVASAILMFWPLLEPAPSGARLHDGLKILYVLGVSIGQLPLFAFLTFATTVFYPTYEAAPRIMDLSPLDDQLLGGALMKLTAAAFMFGGLAVYFYRWYQKEGDRKF